VNGSGHNESVPPTPLGEYPNSCVGRERIFQYFSLRNACPGREPVFAHSEAANAWHSDCREAARLFGAPHVDLETMIRWNADWLQRDMPRLNKPTHYEERGGVF